MQYQECIMQKSWYHTSLYIHVYNQWIGSSDLRRVMLNFDLSSCGGGVWCRAGYGGRTKTLHLSLEILDGLLKVFVVCS